MMLPFKLPIVTLGLDPKALHLPHPPQVTSPRLKAEGDDWCWGAVCASNHRVIPAKAGTPVFLQPSQTEVPAFAGMTPWVGYGQEPSHD